VPLDMLADEYACKATRKSVAAAIARSFPKSVRDEALAGCNEGFAAQDAGGPLRRPE
jgi:hypothetical protein